MDPITFVIPCLFGLEGLVADEARRLGLADVRGENGRVLCQGEAKDIPRLNLNLRCGELSNVHQSCREGSGRLFWQ